MTIRTTRTRAALALLVGAGWLAAPAPPATAACDCTTLPTLGRAGEYPALGLNDILVRLQGSAIGNTFDVDGNVGVTGAGGQVNVDGNASVGGKVSVQPGGTVTCTPSGSCAGKIGGGIEFVDMSGPHADLLAFSAAVSAMTPTQTYGAITRSTTIAGNGCINVIQVNGDIDLGGNRTIRLSGTSDDYFLVNLTGDLLTSGTAEVVLDGMEPSNVVFNLTTPGKRVELAGGSGGNFTIVAPYGEVYLHGTSGGTGAYYAGVSELHFQGEVSYYGSPFACKNTTCPDPELTGANIQTPATPQGRSTGNSSFFYAYFDLADYEGHLEHFRLNAVGTIKDEQDVDAVDPITKEFKATRDPYWDAAIPLRSDTTRSLYTTLAGARADFDTTNVSETDLDLQAGEIPAYPNYPGSGVDTLPELRDAVVGFLHGQDAFDQDGDTNQTELRDAVLGDIFHSNPLFIGNPTTVLRHEQGFESFYQSYEQRDRVVYAGANDGIFHAFHAGAWYDPNDPNAFDGGTGEELFGYVPGLLLPSVKLVPRTDDATGSRLAPSFVDGNIVAADAWLGDGSGTDITKSPAEWATVVIAAFREGGEGYLALDVTDPDASNGDDHFPYPKFLWEFTDLRMGQSWSRPVITRVRLDGGNGTGDHCGVNDGDGDCREQWVAIFSAGYYHESDPNDRDYEDDPTSLAWHNEAKAIFIVALDSGQVLAKLAFDASGVAGPDDMKYALPSQPAVIDLDSDRFADIVLVGDTGGQVWKWDLSAKGVDSDADNLIDNWSAGVFFNAPPTDMGGGEYHYKSFFYPPSAAYVNGSLVYAFASGEREELLYYGDPGRDENNRIWVIKDPNPTGGSAIPASPYTEANLTDITSSAADTNLADMGFFVKADDSEKFLTDVLIFAGHLIVASYDPDTFPSCGPGEAYLYILRLSNGLGHFDSNATPEASDRRFQIGTGIPSTPRISVAPNPTDDVGFINTSDKKVLTFEPPLRDPPESSVLYWKQEF